MCGEVWAKLSLGADNRECCPGICDEVGILMSTRVWPICWAPVISISVGVVKSSYLFGL